MLYIICNNSVLRRNRERFQTVPCKTLNIYYIIKRVRIVVGAIGGVPDTLRRSNINYQAASLSIVSGVNVVLSSCVAPVRAAL